MIAAANATAQRILTSTGPDGFVAAARSHPAAALLFQARSGRLDRNSLMRASSTPHKLYELARSVGVTELAAPPPVSRSAGHS